MKIPNQTDSGIAQYCYCQLSKRIRTRLWVCLVVLGLSFSSLSSPSAAACQEEQLVELQQRIEKLSEQGQPTDSKSLQAFHRKSSSNTDTDAWLNIGNLAVEGNLLQDVMKLPPAQVGERLIPANVPAPGQEWANREHVEQFLADWHEVAASLELLAKGQLQADKHLYRPIVFQGTKTNLDMTQNARTLTHLPRLKHLVAVHDRDKETGFEHIRTMQGISRSFESEPVLISQLMRLYIMSLVCEQVRHSLEFDQLSEEQMQLIADELDDFESLQRSFRLALSGERAMMLPHYTDPDFARTELSLSRRQAEAFMNNCGNDGIHYLDRMAEGLNLSEDDPTQFRQQADELEDRIQNDIETQNVFWKKKRQIALILLPSFGGLANAVVRQCELNRMAKLAISLRQFQHKHKRWPTSLAELAQAEPATALLRPANNQTFGYRVSDSGEAILWSVNGTKANRIPFDPPSLEGENLKLNRKFVWHFRAS